MAWRGCGGAQTGAQWHGCCGLSSASMELIHCQVPHHRPGRLPLSGVVALVLVVCRCFGGVAWRGVVGCGSCSGAARPLLRDSRYDPYLALFQYICNTPEPTPGWHHHQLRRGALRTDLPKELTGEERCHPHGILRGQCSEPGPHRSSVRTLRAACRRLLAGGRSQSTGRTRAREERGETYSRDIGDSLSLSLRTLAAVACSQKQ